MSVFSEEGKKHDVSFQKSVDVALRLELFRDSGILTNDMTLQQAIEALHWEASKLEVLRDSEDLYGLTVEKVLERLRKEPLRETFH